MNGPAESSPKPGIGYRAHRRRPPTPLRTPSFTPRGDVKLQRAVLELARCRRSRFYDNGNRDYGDNYADEKIHAQK